MRLVRFAQNRLLQRFHVENLLRLQTRRAVVCRCAENRQAADDFLRRLRAKRGDGGVEMVAYGVDSDVADRSDGAGDCLVRVVVVGRGIDAVDR